jgi:LysR family transcriptional regulator, pca operon transcriptional activator
MTPPMESSLHRHLSLRHLRLVVVLGRELNLSRTAELLHTTQPAVSRSLAQLESLMGARLFDRTTKRISLTAAGTSLMQHAHRVLAELDLAVEEIKDIRGGISGEVRIGLLPAFSADLLAIALARAREIAPDVLFVVQSYTLAGVYEALLSGRVDLMLSHAELNVDLNTVDVRKLYVERSRVLVQAGHALARRKRVSQDELASLTWVLPPPDTPLRPKLNRLLSVHRKESHRVRDVQADSTQLALSLVRHAGMAWAIASEYANAYEAQGLAKILRTESDLLSGPMCAFVLRNEPVKTPTQVLLNCLMDAAATKPQ